MSRFQRSPPRSPYRTPPRLYETQRNVIIEEQVRLKSALKAEAQSRRVHDQLAMLQIKVRHTAQLQDKCDSLLRQNSQLARQNQELSRQLNERRYEVQRYRAASAEQADREALKAGQLFQVNKSLELQIQLLKKQRMQSNRLYEAHIQKLERMLDQKVIQLDSVNLRCSDLSKQLEITVIKFEQQKNRLKNLMTRTQHQLERQLEYTKQKTNSEKFSQIDAMKRNYTAQVAILEDQISKLKMLNVAKTDEFEAQLAQNRNLRKRHDEQIRNMGAENDDLRARMLKLQQINRSQVENIQVKYNNYHNQGTSNLKQQYERDMQLLLDEIDKLKWLTDQKNNQIQTLVKEKRETRKNMDEMQLQLSSEIDSLKNKLYLQQEKHSSDNHANMQRINELCDKMLKESQGYHQRAKEFNKKIRSLEGQINDKQNQLQKTNNEARIRQKQLQKNLDEANSTIQKTRRELADSQQQRKQDEQRHTQYERKAKQQISKISKKLSEAQVKLEETQDKLTRQTEDNSGSEDLLRVQIQSLRKNVGVLEEKLSQQQQRHSKQMQQLSANINDKVKKLQQAQRKALDQLESSRKQQIQALTLRLEKALHEKSDAESELKRYIAMYEDLQKYFKDPHDGLLFEQKSKDSIYEVLKKVSERRSTVHIF